MPPIALLAALALGATAPADDPFAEETPVPSVVMTVADHHITSTQGGQRVRLTVPADQGLDRFGDDVFYRWDVQGPDDTARCRPGALPDLAGVGKGTKIDAPLPRPTLGWCRGWYGVTLFAHIYTHCDATDATCEPRHLGQQVVGGDNFLVGSEVRSTCHHHGLVELCFEPATHGSAAEWSVTAPFEDVSEDNDEIEALVERAFRGHPELRPLGGRRPRGLGLD
jgi:hypothetical protein